MQDTGDGGSALVTDLSTPDAHACAGGDTRPIGVIRTEVVRNLTLRPWDTSRPPVTARVGRQMVLTPAGIAFEVPARRVLQTTARARARVEAVRGLQAARFLLAALPTLAVDPLPQLVSRLRRRHPGIQVHVSDPGGPVDVENAVRQGRAEIGFTELPVRSESLESRTFGTQRIALVLPPALAEQLPDPVFLAAVAELPLVLHSPVPSNRSAIDEAVECAAANVVVRSAHRQAVWGLVMAGVGATLLHRAIAERELSGVEVRDTVPEIRAGSKTGR